MGKRGSVTMGNSFDKGRLIEKDSLRELYPYLCARFNRLTEITELDQQRTLGDFSYYESHSIKYLELKSELENKYDNLFIETWSNKDKGIKGWFDKLKADTLGYHFIKDKIFYLIPFNDLKNLLHCKWDGKSIIEYFPEKPQYKYDQDNNSFGRCVPIKLILGKLNVEVYDLNNGTKRTSKASHRKD